MKKIWLLLTLFGLFWTAIVSVFDGFLGYGFINQLRAQNFPQVTGYITHSAITTDHSGHSTTYGADIRYHYEVNGQSFEGNRYRYAEGSDSDSAPAGKAVARFSEGSEVSVFYNPQNPADAVLSPGLDSQNFMMLLFMTPFNAVMLGFWLTGLCMVSQKLLPGPNGGVRFSRKGSITRVRLPRFPWFAFPLGATGIVGFIGIFPLVFTAGFHPGFNRAKAALFIAYGSGCLMLLRELWRWSRGTDDLIINSDRNTAELPQTFGRKTKIQIPLAEIKSLNLETVVLPNRDGEPSYNYVPTLVWKNSHHAPGKLAEYLSQAKAQAFVDWLRPQLKISDLNEKSTTSRSHKHTLE